MTSAVPPAGEVPHPTRAQIDAVQAKVERLAGTPLKLHNVVSQSNPDGLRTQLYIALPPGQTPGDLPGHGPTWMVEATQNPQTGDWDTQVIDPSQWDTTLLKLQQGDHTLTLMRAGFQRHLPPGLMDPEFAKQVHQRLNAPPTPEARERLAESIRTAALAGLEREMERRLGEFAQNPENKTANPSSAWITPAARFCAEITLDRLATLEAARATLEAALRRIAAGEVDATLIAEDALAAHDDGAP